MNRTQWMVLALGIGPGLRLAKLAEGERVKAVPRGTSERCRTGTIPADAPAARREPNPLDLIGRQ